MMISIADIKIKNIINIIQDIDLIKWNLRNKIEKSIEPVLTKIVLVQGLILRKEFIDIIKEDLAKNLMIMKKIREIVIEIRGKEILRRKITGIILEKEERMFSIDKESLEDSRSSSSSSSSSS